MPRPYFHMPRAAHWRPPTYVGRWIADQTPTPYVEEDVAQHLVANKFLRPLEGTPRFVQDVVPTLVGLLYGSVLAHVLAGQTPNKFYTNFQEIEPQANAFVRKSPPKICPSLTLQAILMLTGRTGTDLIETTAATRSKMLATVTDWTWRYKPAQILTFGRALLFNALVLANLAKIPPAALDKLFLSLAVTAVQMEVPLTQPEEMPSTTPVRGLKE